MKCSMCGAENPDQKRFCGQCGAILAESRTQPDVASDNAGNVARKPKTALSLSTRAKKKLILGSILVVIILVIAAIGYLYYDTHYYHEPASGTGSVSATTVDVGQSVEFGFVPTSGTSPFSYLWSFGDGGISSEQKPSHSYGSPGTYDVLATVTTRAGETTSWATTIRVNPLPSVVGIVSPSIAVNSLNASFTAQAQGGTPNYTYSWRFGDGASSNEQNPTHHYSLGKYIATVTVRDGVGMTASWSADISVNLPLTVGVIVRWIGPGDTESFSCTPSDGVPPYSFYWVFGDGLSSTLQNFTYNYGTSGTTTVHLTVTDSIGEIFEFQQLIEY